MESLQRIPNLISGILRGQHLSSSSYLILMFLLSLFIYFYTRLTHTRKDMKRKTLFLVTISDRSANPQAEYSNRCIKRKRKAKSETKHVYTVARKQIKTSGKLRIRYHQKKVNWTELNIGSWNHKQRKKKVIQTKPLTTAKLGQVKSSRN